MDPTKITKEGENSQRTKLSFIAQHWNLQRDKVLWTCSVLQ